MLVHLVAHIDPAGGAPTEDLIPAAVIAVVALMALGLVARAHRAGRSEILVLTARAIERVPGTRGLPSWSGAPVALTTLSLATAVFGFYWDVSTHIDNGRDPGPFANPAHFFILAGLAGVAVAGYLAVVLGMEDGERGGVTLRPGWRAPVGGLLLLACGVIALAGFPLDDVWHRIFGQDVTLWGPTHIQMVAGASLSTLAAWMLYLEGVRIAPRAHRRWMEIGLAGAFLVGLATLQGEFDFGVPQFRMLYQPVLLAIAAGVGLVAARVRLGRGGAIGAVCVFVAIRGTLAILVTPILGRSVPHFPLFIVEALVVEVVASVVPDDRPLRFGALAGLLIGTVGFAGEWVWSHIWMPLPWQPTLLPEGIVLVPLAGVAAGLLGALIGRALAGDPIALRPVRRSVVVFAGVVLVAAVAWPLPTDGGHDLRADVSLTDLTSGPQRTAQATIRLQPADAADDNDFFTVTAWQGANWTRQHVVIDRLQQISRGVWRTTQPIPVYGKWKALIRLQNGRTLAATPMFMPEDAGIPAPEVSAPAEFNRPFVPDKQLLQREFTGGPGWLEAAAYTVLLAIAVGWVWLIGWGLQRLLSDSRGNDRDSVPAIASSSGRERVPAGVG